MSTIEQTLQQRQSVHGDFSVNAAITQRLKEIIRASPNYEKLTDVQKEALEMTAHKISRILAGDPNHADHWHDGQGYLKLAHDRIETKL